MKSHFQIIQAEIYADRYPKSAENENTKEYKIDIKNSIIELNIYESIDMPFLTGDIVFYDQYGLNDIYRIQGTEKINLKVKNTIIDEVVYKKFIINGLSRSGSGTDGEVLKIHLIEAFGYDSLSRTVSKSFTGKPIELLESIYNESTKIPSFTKHQIDMDSILNEKEIKYVAPNQRIIDVFNKIKNSINTNNGSPYFVYSTFLKPKLQISDLYSLLKKDRNLLHSNEKIKFVYTHNNTVLYENENGLNSNPLIVYIESFDRVKSDVNNSFHMAISGISSADFHTFDITTGRFNSINHNIHDTINEITDESLPENPTLNYGSLIDDKIKVYNDNTINDIPKRQFSNIISSSLFENELALGEKETDNDYIQHLKRDSIKGLLEYSSYTIKCPGAIFFKKGNNSSVGSLIQLEYYLQAVNKSDPVKLSPEKSGIYMIKNIRHIMKDDTHNTLVDIVRVKIDNRKL